VTKYYGVEIEDKLAQQFDVAVAKSDKDKKDVLEKLIRLFATGKVKL